MFSSMKLTFESEELRNLKTSADLLLKYLSNAALTRKQKKNTHVQHTYNYENTNCFTVCALSLSSDALPDIDRLLLHIDTFYYYCCGC